MAEPDGGRKDGAPDAKSRIDRPSPLAYLRERFSLPGLEAWSTSTRTVFLNALFLVAVIVVLPVLVAQFRRGEVVIEPISVPESLAAQGMTAEVAASRIWDGIQDVRTRAATSKETIDAIPSARQVEFSFPDSGFSIESLVFHLRRLFNAYETRVNGEFVCAEAACGRAGMRLRLRVVRAGVDIVDLPPMGDTPERDYFESAAAGIYGVLDPFVAMAAISEKQPVLAAALGYRMIRSNHPDGKWAYNQVGLIHANEGEMATAVNEFRAAVALDRNFLPARANLGNALLRSGDLDGAEEELTYVQRRKPNDVAVLQGLSDLASARGNADEALAQMMKAANARPTDPLLLTKAANIELSRGRRAEGEALLRQALELDPGFLPAFALLAAPFLIDGDYGAAEKFYRNAADYAPADAAAQAGHGNILALIKEWEKAADRYARAMKLEPGNVGYAIEYAKCLQALGRDAEALAALEAMRTTAPGDADLYRSIGDSLRALGRKPEAIAAYRKFLSLDRTGSVYRPIAEAWIKDLSS